MAEANWYQSPGEPTHEILPVGRVIALIVLSGAVFVFALMGFSNQVNAGAKPLPIAPGAKCSTAQTHGRYFAATCDDGSYFMVTQSWSIDYSHPITQDEFAARACLAQKMTDGWAATIDIHSTDPQVTSTGCV